LEGGGATAVKPWGSINNMWMIIGYSAAVLTMFAFIPQIAKVVKTKCVEDLSVFTLCQLALGVALWIAYGVHKRDAVIILANSVTLTTMAVLLFMYFLYGRNHK